MTTEQPDISGTGERFWIPLTLQAERVASTSANHLRNSKKKIAHFGSFAPVRTDNGATRPFAADLKESHKLGPIRRMLVNVPAALIDAIKTPPYMLLYALEIRRETNLVETYKRRRRKGDGRIAAGLDAGMNFLIDFFSLGACAIFIFPPCAFGKRLVTGTPLPPIKKFDQYIEEKTGISLKI